ncbi:MAG: hypothetical protein Q7K38_00885 [Candidatus Wildermuthbacteria bacterium]|nr:hypothetical protein [Candidatus Wildermuthbacteria bacterium]
MNDVQTKPALKTSLPSAFSLLNQAFLFYFAHWKTIIGIVTIPTLLSIAQLFGNNFLFLILSLLIGSLSYMALLIATVREGKPEGGVVGAYKEAIPMLIPYTWLLILYGITIWGGFLLFIVPGIVLTIWLSLAFYVLLAENKKGFAALTSSYRYIKGYWWPVLWRWTFFPILFITLQVVIVFFVSGGSFFWPAGNSQAMQPKFLWANLSISLLSQVLITPLAVIYFYGIYRALKEIKAGVSLQIEEAKFKIVLIAFMIFGILGIIALLALMALFSILALKYLSS